MKKISLIAVLLITLFVVNVSAGPLNSFEQNPIPYWDDLSLDVATTWDSTEQTVTVGYSEKNEAPYYDGMEDVTEWSLLNGIAPTSTGTIMEWEHPGDAVWDFVQSDEPSALNGWTFFIRYKSNITTTETLRVYVASLDGFGGSTSIVQSLTPTTSWQLHSEVIIQDVECIRFGFHSPTDPTLISIDYVAIRSGIGELDIGFPITRQDSQEIELYVNSTFLNSETRLEIYDDTQALNTYCVFNSSYVVFQDNEYAQTDGLARIEFSLDNARKTGTITVFAENNTLINQYESGILSGTTFLRMTGSLFNGSIILIYLNGDLSYSAEYSIVEELFLNTNFIGYIGPLALVFAGWFLLKKDRGLGLIAFIVESLFIAQYFVLVESTPDYWWHIFILIFGMLFTVVFQLWDR